MLINSTAAISALVSGLITARYWWQSSKVNFDPWRGDPAPLDHQLWTLSVTVEFNHLMNEAGRLNAADARWTAATSLLAAIQHCFPF